MTLRLLLRRTTLVRMPVRSFASMPSLADADWLDDDGVYRCFTDNRFVRSKTDNKEAASSSVINPATGEILGKVIDTDEGDFDKCVAKASKAFEKWRTVSIQQRQRVMLDLQRLIREKEHELAEILTLENGKTLIDAKGDIFRGLEVVESACHVAPHLLGDSMAGLSSTVDCVSYREPLGVTAGICPFNFPAMIPLWMFPLAIASGNTMILKPSERTPSSALMLARLAAEAGLPENVLQVVHGGRATVDRICTAPEIKAISFVGGNAAGEHIHDLGSRHGKRVQANLGAKNHAICLADADRAATTTALVGAGFGAAGQRCMALSTVVLVGDTYEWLDDIVDKAKKLMIGPGWEEGVDLGPLISADSKKRVESIISKSIEQGAECLLDGRGHEGPGNFVGPTVLVVPDTDNIAYTEEIFGPVLVCLKAGSLEAAVDLVNRSRYGNGAALFTGSGAKARQFTHTIEAGQVGINVPIPVPLPMFSFTGNKASIRGDINFYGRSGVNFYTQLKTVTSNWPYRPTDLGGVTMPTVGKK